LNSHIDISNAPDPDGKPQDSTDVALNALLPNERAMKFAKFAKHYPSIEDAIQRGVTQKDIRKALAADGLSLSAVTFKKLLESLRQQHKRDIDIRNNAEGE